MDQLVSSLRALTISRGSPPTLADIIEDYEEFEGRPIEVKKYGFSTIQEFLVRSGEFILSFKHGQTYVAARPHKDTEHITNMVKKQKKSKRKRKSCKIYAHNFHIHSDGLSSRNKKRQAEREESESPKRRRSSSPDFGLVSSSTIVCPPAPEISSRKNYQRPSPVHFDDSGSDSLPNSTFNSFHESFPEIINNYNAIEVAVALEVFCAFEWIDPPFYHVYVHPHYRGFLCEVLVGNDYFNTEPQSFRTHLEAKLHCAFIALRSLHNRAIAQKRSSYGKNPRVLARKIYRELGRYHDGVSTKLIPAMFEAAYGECLPPNWMSVIKRSSLFNLRVSRTGNVYVSANLCRN